MSDRPACILVTYDPTGLAMEPNDYTRRPGLMSARIEIARNASRAAIAQTAKQLAIMLMQRLRADGPKHGSNQKGT